MSGKRGRDCDPSSGQGGAIFIEAAAELGVPALSVGRDDRFLAWSRALAGQRLRVAASLPEALSELRREPVALVLVHIPGLEFRPHRAFEALALEAPGVPLLGVDGPGHAAFDDLEMQAAGMTACVTLGTPRTDAARLVRSLMRRGEDQRRDAERHKQLMRQLVRFETWTARRLAALSRFLDELEREASAQEQDDAGRGRPERRAAAGALRELARRGRQELLGPPEIDADLDARSPSGRTLVSPRELCDEAIGALRTEAGEHGIQLRLEGRERPRIWADRIRLTQALVDLGKNAIRAGARGSTVTFAAGPEDAERSVPWPRVVVVVGLDRAAPAAGRADAEAHEGRLQDAARIVDEHGGELEAEAAGSVRVVLPVDPRRRRRRAAVRVVRDAGVAGELLGRLARDGVRAVEVTTGDDVESVLGRVEDGDEVVLVAAGDDEPR